MDRSAVHKYRNSALLFKERHPFSPCGQKLKDFHEMKLISVLHLEGSLQDYSNSILENVQEMEKTIFSSTGQRPDELLGWAVVRPSVCLSVSNFVVYTLATININQS